MEGVAALVVRPSYMLNDLWRQREGIPWLPCSGLASTVNIYSGGVIIKELHWPISSPWPAALSTWSKSGEMTKGIPLSGMFWLSPTTGSLRVFPGQVQAEVSFQGEVCLSVLIQPHAPQMEPVAHQDQTIDFSCTCSLRKTINALNWATHT